MAEKKTPDQPDEKESPETLDAVQDPEKAVEEADVVEQDVPPSDVTEEEVSEPEAQTDQDQSEAVETLVDSEVPAQPNEPEIRVVERRGGFVPVFLGGVVAAGIGFVAGQGGVFDNLMPPGMKPPDQTVAVENLTRAQADLSDRIAGLTALVEGAETVDLSPLQSDLDSIAQRIEAVESAMDGLSAGTGDVADLEDRISALELRPVSGGASDEAIAAYEAELARAQAALAEQRSQVEQMIAAAQTLDAESAEAARIASAQTAVARIQARLDTGEPIAAILSELEELNVAVPDALAAASGGVATNAALAAEFTPAARNALSADREANAGTGGLSGYLKRHLNVRSVTPKEGTDADAVLSRAEAAVAVGDLKTALAEIEALPDEARAEMSAWEAAARLRADALAATDELAQSLTTN